MSKLYLNISIPLIIILLSTMGAACSSREAVHELQSIERIIPENPDSALSVLEKNSTLAKKGREAKALYSLLLTEARYKNAIRDTADSLIRPAVEYYGMSDDDRHRAKTFFMAGNLDFNAGEYGEAVINCLRAEKSAMQAGDHLMLGLIYRLIADSFEKVMDWESALHYRKLSYKSFRDSKATVYERYSTFDIARCYYSLERYDSALYNIDDLYSESIDDGDLSLAADAMRLKGECLFENGNFDETLNCINIALNLTPARKDDYKYIGLSLLHKGDVENARKYKVKADSIDSSDGTLDIAISKFDGDFKKAFEILTSEVDYQNSVVSTIWQRDYSNLISNYYDIEISQARKEMENRNKITALAIISMILLIVSAISFSFFRSEKLKRKIESSMHIASELRDKLEIKESEFIKSKKSLSETIQEQKKLISDISLKIDSYSQKIRDLSIQRDKALSENKEKSNVCDILQSKLNDRQNYIDCLNNEIFETSRKIKEYVRLLSEIKAELSEYKDRTLIAEQQRDEVMLNRQNEMRNILNLRISEIGKLCDTYYTYQNGESGKKKIHNQVMSLLNGLKSNGELLKRLEKELNVFMNDIVANFRNDYPNLKTWEYDLFIYLVLGFSSNSISFLQDISTATVYSRKSKLKNKIELDNKEASSNYLAMIR